MKSMRDQLIEWAEHECLPIEIVGTRLEPLPVEIANMYNISHLDPWNGVVRIKIEGQPGQAVFEKLLLVDVWN